MGTAGQSITLANSIIGVGILAMPFCFQQCGVLLATLILLFMGLVSRLCCYFLLKSALLARRRNFEFLAFHVFGPAGKLAVEIGIIGFLMGTCIAYFVVVGDLGPQIIAKLFHINQSDILRTSIMVLVSLLCVLPLGLLRNVDSLSNVSAATIGFYFCLVLKVIAEAASQLWSGERQAQLALWRPAGVLQCVPIFSMALFCQTQLFEIFECLPTLSLEKMNLVTKNAINICTSVYFTLGVFGYIAFCSQQISGNILMSLSPTLASDVIKLGFVMSVAFSFPLIIFPCRASLYSLLYKKVHSSHHDHIINHSIPETSFRCITVVIIAVSLFVSLLIPNIELVLGLVGSTIGVMVCIVFPAACFVNVTFKNTNERVLAKGVLVFGLIIMVLGTYANLQAAESQKDKYDERYITPEKIDKMVEEFFEKMDKSDDDGIFAKPVNKNDVKDDNFIKDSKALPPNPVPPEIIENPRKIEETKNENIKVLDEPIKDMVSVTHPKNLKKINDLNSKNGESNKLSNGDKISNEDTNKINVNIPMEEKQVNEDKEQMEKKQQQLIETIKQHGEEQKELLKEQKVLLDEILKTKKEIAEKNEAEKSIEAKKIAVESIKKIADMAIQSLAGVSEKPAEDKKDDIGKIADEAVQEIAKKAVETIEAIKEINEKAGDRQEEKAGIAPSPALVPSQNIIQPAQNVQQPVQTQNANPPVPNVPVAQNQQPVQNLQQPAQNVQQPAPIVQQPAQNVQQPAQNLQQPIQNLQQPIRNAQQAIQNEQQPAQIVQPAQIIQQPAQIIQQPVQNVPQPAQSVQQPAQNVQQPIQNEQQPAPIVQQPVQYVQQPAQNIQQPIQNVQQSIQNVQQPAPVVQQPVQNVQQAAQNVQQAAQNVQQPAQNVQQAAQNVQQAAQNVQQPAQNVQQAAQNVQQPAQNVQQAAQNVQQPAQNVQQAAQNVQQAAQNVQQPAQNVQQAAQNVQQPAQNVQQAAQNVQQPAQNVQQAAQNVQQPAQNVQQAAQNVQQPAQNVQLLNVQPPQNAESFQNNVPQSLQNVEQPVLKQQLDQQDLQNVAAPVQNIEQPVQNVLQAIQNGQSAQNVQMPANVVQFVSNNQPVQNANSQAQSEQKQHLHSPDEPKSYQQGEDAQKPDGSNINNIQPVAQINHIDNSIAIVNEKVENSANVKPVSRQKREVVDCTEKSTLKPEDKEICERLINVPQYKINDKNEFPKVDLNDVGLPRILPLDNLIHIGRSLKSYDDNENR